MVLIFTTGRGLKNKKVICYRRLRRELDSNKAGARLSVHIGFSNEASVVNS